MKKAFVLAATFLLVVGCGGQKTQSPTAQPTAEPSPETLAQAEPAQAPEEGILKDTLTAGNLPENLFINIRVRDFGLLKVKFAVKDAPKNVTNVANLAIKGFYNGLTFHRLIPGFMIQGGDPQGTGMGGPGYTIEAEIKGLHRKGSMAMARTGDEVNPQRRSSGSQFYICFAPAPFLDGKYTVIGELVEGTSVLEALEKVPTGEMDRPTKPLVMETVTVTTR